MSDDRIRLPYYVGGLPGCRGTLLVPRHIFAHLEDRGFIELAELPPLKPYDPSASVDGPVSFTSYRINLLRYHFAVQEIDALKFDGPKAVKLFRAHIGSHRRPGKRARRRPRYSLHDR